MCKVKGKIVSSLEKVFLDDDGEFEEIHKDSMLLNERYSFQLALTSFSEGGENIKIHIVSPIKECITPFLVGNVPSDFPAFPDADEHYLKTEPGLFPDVLYDCPPVLNLAYRQWSSVWFLIDTKGKVDGGVYPIDLLLTDESDKELRKLHFTIEIIPARLPNLTLFHTEWIHTDCLASHYRVDIFGDRYWELLKKYLKLAVRYDINTLLTPVFTPPLDTQIGGERPTVQLVEVTVSDGDYLFSFDRLRKWILLGLDCGIQYFEISHLFTQWGAKSAPKVVAYLYGQYQKFFGWETVTASVQYAHFLTRFLQELKGFLIGMSVFDRCFFHISDEPAMCDMERYASAMAVVSSVIPKEKIIDAMSDFDFFQKGISQRPIPATDHLEPFLEHGVANLWTYYCCGQNLRVSNRFMAMPSYRNRILGAQLYKFDIHGFLHWGFNFWYSRNSVREIDPYQTTDADGAFPSGDAFVVYPGENGPIPSLRLLVFYEGLQDFRALKLLETYTSKEEVLKLMEEEMDAPLSFTVYPQSAERWIAIRQKVDEKIKSVIGV